LNSVPSIHMRCRMTASFRATATLALTISARGSAARRLPRTDTCGAWRHRTSRFDRTNRFPRRHGVGSSIRYRPLDRLKRLGSSIVALKQSAVIGPTRS
jgi:hypothetical protein